jgi:hypothetical protein
MLFSKILTGVAMAATAVVAASPQQVADGFKVLTQKSQAVLEICQSINSTNAHLIAMGQGPLYPLINQLYSLNSASNSFGFLLKAHFHPVETRPEPAHARDLKSRDSDANPMHDLLLEVSLHPVF